jgi:hypothetical protein
VSPRRLLRQALLLAAASPVAHDAAFAQSRVRRMLVATPHRITVGQSVNLSVAGAVRGSQYRYTAFVAATWNGRRPRQGCPAAHAIGSGASVTWLPVSGSYRLTAVGPLPSESDTLTLAYVVLPRTVMLASSQTSAQSGTVHVGLRTDDLGPGHTYVWWLQLRGQPTPTGGGTAQPGQVYQPWTSQTTGPLTTYPTPIPAPASLTATVDVHRGNPCEVIAAGAIPPA